MVNNLVKKTDIPEEILVLKDGRKLAYGENRCQSPAYLFYGGSNNPLAMGKFEVVSGDPSYIALADVSQLVSILCLMSEAFQHWQGKTPYIAIVGKHGNPCGAAIDWEYPDVAIRKALHGDPVAAMGGELITNYPLELGLANVVFYSNAQKIGRDKWGLDVIAAPSFSDDAIDLLGRREKRRLLANPALAQAPFPKEEWTYRELHGGDWLKQRLSTFVLWRGGIIHWTGRGEIVLWPEEIVDRTDKGDIGIANLIIAFACCWRASSNTVALAKDGMLIGLGCGQQDRIACVRLCLDRANRASHDAKGSVFASDAFFPYATSKVNIEEMHRIIDEVDTLNESLNGKSLYLQMKLLDKFTRMVSRLDRREGPELLADAGCIGGVVPADGNKLEEVKEFFHKKKMSVAFVAPENRGFSKH